MSVFRKAHRVVAIATISLGFAAAGPLATVASAVEVGDTIPALETVDQNGGMQNLASLAPNKGVVLVFTRSLHW